MFIAKGATFRVAFKAYLASDHVTAAGTGLTIVMAISKNGAAFAAPSGGSTAVSIGNGWYYIDLSATDTGTIGPLCIHGSSATIDAIALKYDIMEAHSGLIDVNAQIAAGTTVETSASMATAVRTEMDSNSADLNTLVTGVGALATSVAGLATAAALTTVGSNVSTVLAAVDTEVAAIKTKTDFLPSAAAGAAGGVALVGSAMTLTSGERDAVATASWNLANGIMTGFTPGRMMRLFSTNLLGKVAIAGTAVDFTDILNGSPTAIHAITTADGQRTTVTLNQT